MAGINENEARRIGREYLDKWRSERTAAVEGLSNEVRDFLKDSKKPSQEEPTSELYKEFVKGMKDGTYKKPSDFFKAKCRSLFNGIIYPRRENDFYYIADHMQDWAYSESKYRRSLRTSDLEILCRNIMGAVYDLYEQDHIDADICDIIEGKNITEEQLYHKEYAYYNFCGMDEVVAAEIDMGNVRMIKLASDIIMCESDILPDHMMFSAVVKCHNTELHEKLGRLLLAARLQEGLRQAICEKMDTGTKEAFFTLLDVILENNLIRFSSVKRAVGVWLGFIEEETVKLERISDKSIELISDSLRDDKLREEYLASEDSMKIYIALWSIGFYDVGKMLEKIREYSERGSEHQLLVAGYMTGQLDNAKLSGSIAKQVIKAHKDNCKALAVYMKSFMPLCIVEAHTMLIKDTPMGVSYERFDGTVRKYASLEKYFESAEEAEEMYSLLMEIYKGISKRSIDFSPCIFPWNSEKLERSDIVERLAYLASALRDNDKIDETAALIPQIDGGRGTVLELLLAQPETDIQRRILTAEVCDKEEYTRRSAFKIINKAKISDENYAQLEEMLRYKNADMRSNCIHLLMKQEDDKLFETVSRLISDKKEEKRTAALDILICLSESEEHRSLFEKARPLAAVTEMTTTKEKILIERINPSSATAVEKLPVYDPNASYTPMVSKKFLQECEKTFDEYFYKSSDIEDVIKKLVSLISEHETDEFADPYNGEVMTMRGYRHFRTNYKGEKFSDIPFRDMWEDFYQSQIKSPVMLYRMYIYLLSEGDHDEYSRECVKQLSKIIGEPFAAGGEYPHRLIMFEICDHLLKKHGDEKAIYNIAAYFACKLCTDLDSFVINAKDSRGIESKYSLLHCYQAQALLDPLRSLGDDNFADIFAIKYSLAEKPQSVTSNVYGRKFYITGHFARVTLDAGDYIKAAFNGVISVDFMYKMFFEKKYKYYYTEETFLGKALDYVSLVYAGIREYNAPVCTKSRRSVLAANYLKSFIGKNAPKEYTDTDKKLIGFTEKIYDTLIEEVVGTELKRGDTETKYTADIGKLNRIYGADKLAAILSALGSETLDRRSYYTKKTKKESLSHLLAVCLPLPEDNADTLRKAAEGTDITEKRLIEAAMYSPEWLPIVGEYLGWEGFTSACYYFIAHMNERFDDKRKAVIAKYTPLTDEELNEGAFDINWFKSAYENLGKKRFDMIYDAAKYISDGAKHSRARKYADAVLGKMNPDETVKTIADKRNKDLLMAYALIPIKDEDDICTRYLYLQQFLKESKKFGSQRSASEKKAVETSMQNLSINAGYADITRLTLRMETKLIDDSRELFEDKEIDGAVFRLSVDASGKTEIICTKGGKALKSIPAKLKKNEYIVRLTDTKKKLIEQYRRTRAMFETAMEESTEFTVSELNILRNNPVVLPVIKDLVFVCGENLGFLNGNELTDYSGNVTPLSDDDRVITAHPFALYSDGHWADYQKYLFENHLVQPFKQVFRELYVKTSEEAEMTHSLRYSGNQIQPGKTAACLKSRRWVADVEDGLQKVYYKENIVARIYAMADWFSPADIEAPTLEWVEFTDRKTGKPLVIKDIPDIIFSEVMRDVDLAVSVAHAGGVDPETSHSTVEMRAALIGFTLPLFKLTNVTLKGSHAHISGKYGEYTLHLGSGVIHKQGGTMINILPVHSQHRGKLFLPFADEDPKTAEIITKVLFLAEDSKIKDPSILEQIK